MPIQLDGGLLSWADDLDIDTLAQARRCAALPFVEGHVALMPDTHLGYGATVGSVIPMRGALVPYAVGVDIGCGMIAVRTDLMVDHLPDDLGPLLSDIEEGVPAGVGQGHLDLEARGPVDFPEWFDGRHKSKAETQYGTLGSGNHFIEVCTDATDRVWVVLHSGSRGIGHKIATMHVDIAKGLMKRYFIKLDDPNLAYLVQGTSEFDAYASDLQWAQQYAYGNREAMMNVVLDALFDRTGNGAEVERINCHHNYAALEHHRGQNVWVTRKGAISARPGQAGIIPGSMGTNTFIVEGLGHPGSYTSSAHGAGRRMGRKQAKRELTIEAFTEAMGDRTWLVGQAESLLDEAPAAYKDIDHVMRQQADLVTVREELTQVLNYKGT